SEKRANIDNLTGIRILYTPRGPMKKFALLSLAAVTVTAACLLLLFDPFNWLAGTPPVHDAKKRIALSLCLIFLFGIPGIWFMIIQPLQTGVTLIDVRPYTWALRELLRSGHPLRFRFNIFLHFILLAVLFAVAITFLIASIRDLEKAQSAIPPTN